jgi:hypothetical protein
VVLGIEAGDHRIAGADMRHRQHARRLDRVEPSLGGEAEQALVPLPQIVVGPKHRLGRLLVGSGRALEPAQPLHLPEVSRILPARQRRRAIGTKLPWTVEGERPDP